MTQQFDGQRENEQVELVFRRHVIALRKGFYSLLIPFAVCSIPALICPNYLWLFYLSFGAFGLGLILLAYHWVGWYYTYFIITNQRLRQVRQKALFGRSVVDLGLGKIQNISYEITGFSGEVFGFGTIVVQTYVGDLVLDRVHNPNKIYNRLQDAVQKAGHGANTDEENN